MFIQTYRRQRKGARAQRTQCGGSKVATARQPAERAVPHSPVVDKIGRDTLGVSNSSPQVSRLTVQTRGPALGKIKPQNLLPVKTSGDWGRGRNFQSLRRGYFKGLHGPRTNANPPTLGTTTGTVARGVPVAYGKGVK